MRMLKVPKLPDSYLLFLLVVYHTLFNAHISIGFFFGDTKQPAGVFFSCRITLCSSSSMVDQETTAL